jgi:hypothetical protein
MLEHKGIFDHRGNPGVAKAARISICAPRVNGLLGRAAMDFVAPNR